LKPLVSIFNPAVAGRNSNLAQYYTLPSLPVAGFEDEDENEAPSELKTRAAEDSVLPNLLLPQPTNLEPKTYNLKPKTYNGMPMAGLEPARTFRSNGF
jgi:hypothetical protein